MEEVSFDFATQFWEAYPDNKKFLKISSNKAHDRFGDNLKESDDRIVKFLEEFRLKGYLKDSILLIVSDHGAHRYTTRYTTIPDDSRPIEHAFPLLITFVPTTIGAKTLDFIESNQQKFINHHDTYTTLKSIAVGKISSAPRMIAYSYLQQNLPSGRDVTVPVCEGCDPNSTYPMRW